MLLALLFIHHPTRSSIFFFQFSLSLNKAVPRLGEDTGLCSDFLDFTAVEVVLYFLTRVIISDKSPVWG